MGEDRTKAGTERYTVSEAAEMLGITTGAVRNRLSRGTLAKVKESGTVYVLLSADMLRDAERDTDDTPPGMSHGESDALTSELRDRLRYVEGQLESERQSHAEARRIIAGLVERMPALEAPTDTPLGPRESTEGAAEGGGRGEIPQEQQRPVERSWWRRVFGR